MCFSHSRSEQFWLQNTIPSNIMCSIWHCHLGTEMYYNQSIHNDELVNDLLFDEVQWQKLCAFLWTVLILTELFLIQINK